MKLYLECCFLPFLLVAKRPGFAATSDRDQGRMWLRNAATSTAEQIHILLAGNSAAAAADDGKRFFEAVESWTTGGGGSGARGRRVGLICRISRQKKTAKHWVNCSLAAYLCKNLSAGG